MRVTLPIHNRVSTTAEPVIEISNNLLNGVCGSLDEMMKEIQTRLLDRSQELTDLEIEDYILRLSSVLFFVSSEQENLGIKEDVCKAIRQEVYNKAREEAKGTVADKDASATLASQSETVALSVYSRTYKRVKQKVDAGFEMLNSLKKVLTRRISELELSNSRYIGKQQQ